MQWISVLERLACLILAETLGFVPRTLADCCSALLKFDETLHLAHTIVNSTKLFEDFLKHMSAQFCLHFATLIFKKAKIEQNNWKEATKNVQPLLLLALTDPVDPDAPYTITLNENHKRLLQFWKENGYYRICQAGINY